MHGPKPKFCLRNWNIYSILFGENPLIWEVIQITVLLAVEKSRKILWILKLSGILLLTYFHSRNNLMDWLFCLLSLLGLVFVEILKELFYICLFRLSNCMHCKILYLQLLVVLFLIIFFFSSNIISSNILASFGEPGWINIASDLNVSYSTDNVIWNPA